MRALIIEISFSEAFFKVHYTRGFRLTYPIPLPTSVAGIFGAFLGVKREELSKKFNGMFFGAKMVKYESIISENATFIQYKGKGPEKGVTQISIINNPTFLIAAASEEEKIVEIEEGIKNGVKFLPYGGQNDFFTLDWKVKECDEVEESDEITNYAPQDWVIAPILESSSEVQILPVRHNLSENLNFYFVIKGRLKLKKKILTTKNEKIGLYKLEDFPGALDGQVGASY
jgi:CRISPR-associated Cas5-like protein